MIVTNNTFVSYFFLKGSVSLQLALLAIGLYTVFYYPGAVTNELVTMDLHKFKIFTNYVVVSSNALLLILNIITDYFKVEGLRTLSTILAMTINLMLLCVLTTCLAALPADINALVYTEEGP